MKQIKGVISALPTPFLNNQVDYGSLKKLVEYQLKNGIDGFVVNGTTAESPTLNTEEVQKIYKLVREISGTQVSIILGTGSNSTEDTKLNTAKAQDMGADAALVVVPYYNKPPQRGLVQHFTAVAEAAPKLPIILYNVPGRTITSMTAETIQSLTTVKNIVAIKEASGDLAFDEALVKTLPKAFTLLSGDDPTYISFLKLGGVGVISVMSNVITAACAKWTKLAADQKFNEAHADFEAYKNLINLIYVEANPIPVKWMLYKMGLFTSAEMRLPLVSLDSKHFEGIAAEMKKLGLI
jgi:4-hydroxy-tetrahydrodipicolinate synthase